LATNFVAKGDNIYMVTSPAIQNICESCWPNLISNHDMPPLATKFVDKLWVGSVYTVFNLSQTELYPSYISLLCPHERPPLWGVDIPHNPVHVVQGCSGPQDMRKQPLEQSKGLWSKQSTRKKNEN